MRRGADFLLWCWLPGFGSLFELYIPRVLFNVVAHAVSQKTRQKIDARRDLPAIVSSRL